MCELVCPEIVDAAEPRPDSGLLPRSPVVVVSLTLS